jgi:5-methylcytosine-specific restriction enzyme A
MAKLRTLSPLVQRIDTRVVPLPPKQADPIYATPEYRAWQAKIIARAGARCEAVDAFGLRCTKAKPEHRLFADHIVELKDNGQPFDLNNGMCLCYSHHTIKTLAMRARRHRA